MFFPPSLYWATLYWATLYWATLYWATLYRATLYRATLYRATLYRAMGLQKGLDLFGTRQGQGVQLLVDPAGKPAQDLARAHFDQSFHLLVAHP